MNNAVLNGMKVLGRRGNTLWVRLPSELQRPCGTCSCPYCKAHPAEVPMWDTLAIPIAPPASSQDTTWTVHLPDPLDAK